MLKRFISKYVLIFLLLLGALVVLAQRDGLWLSLLQPTPAQNTVHLSCPKLQLGCQFTIEQTQYRIIADEGISGAKPFTVKLEGRAGRVEGSWQMQGMEMGPNNYRFIANGDTAWQAKMVLPMCTQSRQDWLLILNIDQIQVQIQTSSDAS
ncbi:hypothetical protein HZU75_13170 [Chitinibacter fontanus]|uniref:Uncharacterized protein n=1 Tax=Chitinibacter fontanus TaxID=1737446 RepID=A0A7D5VAM9_9NEIS|nr:hypothetical protein [Chitinibacter fontanus]QLI82397.1 hypothetical protein HZU75_13170 [Chitinibacter fontanus]